MCLPYIRYIYLYILLTWPIRMEDIKELSLWSWMSGILDFRRESDSHYPIDLCSNTICINNYNTSILTSWQLTHILLLTLWYAKKALLKKLGFLKYNQKRFWTDRWLCDILTYVEKGAAFVTFRCDVRPGSLETALFF